MILILKVKINGNKIISISVKLEEHNFTKVAIKEKNKEAKHIKIIPLMSELIFLKKLSMFYSLFADIKEVLGFFPVFLSL